MGRVKSQGNDKTRKTKMMKMSLLNTGYLIVKLSKQGKVFPFLVHRLVAEAFVPNPENKEQVNHLNETKTDNRACNLSWVSLKENINYGSHNKRSAESRKGKVNYCKHWFNDGTKNVMASECPEGFTKGFINPRWVR